MNARTKVTAAEFQNNFGRYADAAREAPVVVTRYGREELVVLSAAEYERLRASYRRVIVLNETTPDEAAELLQALATAPATPAAQALDHLMPEVKRRRR
ncbi:MAG: type II toxin-antitoxin system prevent-host-death family antitoxin [Alphaproteobacteria bacterium]|nr:type II toxin-antitoxin system prevent-host-death family antitoxin [Alphaproteobacteria bacterium]